MACITLQHVVAVDRNAIVCEPQRIGHRCIVIFARSMVLHPREDSKMSRRRGKLISAVKRHCSADFVLSAEDGDQLTSGIHQDPDTSLRDAVVVPDILAV